MQRINSISNLAFISMIACTTTYALESDYSKPINVDSMKQTADLATNQITFLNDVVITQGTIQINADKVVILRNKEGNVSNITAYGNPAKFSQMMENDRPIKAEAFEKDFLDNR